MASTDDITVSDVSHELLPDGSSKTGGGHREKLAINGSTEAMLKPERPH